MAKSTKSFERADHIKSAEVVGQTNRKSTKTKVVNDNGTTSNLVPFDSPNTTKLNTHTQPNKGGDKETKLVKMVEGLEQMIASSVASAEGKLQAISADIEGLTAGKLTVEEISSKYGELTLAQADELTQQLERVNNSLIVEKAKTLTEREAISVKTEQALTQLAGLKSAFILQAAATDVADAKDEADYREQVRDQKNVTRSQDIDYRRVKNELDKADKADKIAHTVSSNETSAAYRSSTREAANASLQLRQYKTAQKVSVTDRILNKVNNNKGK
jgi:hypothetical protein